MGSFGFTAFVVARHWGCRVDSGSLSSIWSALGGPGVRRIHSGSLCSFGRTLRVVAFTWDRSGAPWGFVGFIRAHHDSVSLVSFWHVLGVVGFI